MVNKMNMQKIIVITLIISFCLILIPFNVKAIGEGWLTDWNNRCSFYYSSTETTIDYQSKLVVINQTGLSYDSTFYIVNSSLSSFHDLRVTNNDGLTLLPIWNQSTYYSLNCTFWVKFPMVNTTYYLYWNNSLANNVWNQSAVFIDVIGGLRALGRWVKP